MGFICRSNHTFALAAGYLVCAPASHPVNRRQQLGKNQIFPAEQGTSTDRSESTEHLAGLVQLGQHLFSVETPFS